MITIHKSHWFQPELWAWITALVLLGLFPPGVNSLSLCPLDHLGWWCPGDGLGLAISQVLHMKFMTSIETHLLGIPATLFLLIRSTQLIFTFYINQPRMYANTKIST